MPALKGLFQTFDIIGLPVVEAVKGTDVKDYFFLRNFISGFTFCTGSLGSNPENDLLELSAHAGDGSHSPISAI